MRRYILSVMLGLISMLSACSAAAPPASHPPSTARQVQMSAHEVADINQYLEKYGTPSLTDVAQLPILTPDVVTSAFERNQKAADSLYGNKWLKVQGKLFYGPTNEGFDGLDIYYLALESKGKRMAFLFYGKQHQQQLNSLKHGQMLTIVGLYTPGERYNPKLLGCRLLAVE